jgi:hypothetical protein
MSLPFSRRVSAAAIACLACLLPALPSAASGATGKYPPDAAARGFNGGLAGWTGSSSFDGNCLAPAFCPSATNSFEASGGADGGGYIRSAYQGVAGVTAVGGTTTAVFTSPRFTYRGADGQAPTEVAFEMDRRASVDQLLAVSGNSATYSVRLVDVGAGGETSTLVAPTTLAGASSWRNAPRASGDPDRLTIGHDYRILITSTYVTGTSALVSGNADYDNVVLSATREQRRNRGRPGAGGAGISRERLSDLVRAAQPGTAVLKGKGSRLFVRVKCPGSVGRTCRIAAQGMLTKRKPATARRTVTLRKGKAKLLMLRVKPKARDKVAKRKRLLVRHRVRAGKATATVYKQRKLIRR